jgi:type 1 glutamine amidotransferase
MMRVWRKWIVCVTAALLLAACSSRDLPSGPSAVSTSGAPVRVLMLTATAGFRHDSIPTARQVMSTLAADIRVTATEDLRAITAASLREYDVLFFALTSGELEFDQGQKAAILDFVDRGGGFVGAHSATDTLYGWAEYGGLVGAYFQDHPWTQQATVVGENLSHPIMTGQPSQLAILEEFYTFRENPRSRVDVLLRLDPASVGASGDYPLAWARTQGGGRVYYNALGHFSSTWTNASFQRQLAGAMRWVARRL